MEEAIYSDCCLLVSNFMKNEKPSFANFSVEWKKLSFQHIFAAQTSYNELRQTVAAVFHIGKRLMTISANNSYRYLKDFDVSNEESRTLTRIGGLYLLYAFYFKQPLEEYVKIEVSLETWREMKKFVTVDLLKENDEYEEARYIFWKLYESKAFRFTAMDFCAGLENLVDYDNLDRVYTNSGVNESSAELHQRLVQNMKNFTEMNEAVPTLVTLEDNYNQMKSSLTEEHNLDKQLLPPTNIFKRIQESFGKIEDIIKSTEGVDNAKCSLKVRDFSLFEKEDKIPVAKKKSSRKDLRRMSSRTIFAEKLPEDIENLKGSMDAEDNGTYTELDFEADDDESSDVSNQSSNAPENELFDMNQENKLFSELLDDI